MNTIAIDDVRRLVALACEYSAMIDVVFEQGGDVRVSVYPSDKPAMIHSDGNGNVSQTPLMHGKAQDAARGEASPRASVGQREAS